MCVFQSVETLDNGKPFSDALKIDVELSVGYARYMAGMADKIVGQTIAAGFSFELTSAFCSFSLCQ